MDSLVNDEGYDLNKIIVKPLYFGMLVNIVIPMVLLLVCYYLEAKGNWSNSIGEFAGTLFYVLIVLSLAQAGWSLWQRGKLFNQPLIKRKETFEEDIIKGLLKRAKPIFVSIALIALYGYVFFFLTGRFKETVFFVVFSFIVFQVVRPRFGFVKKLIKSQKKLIEQGKFYNE